jgi:hypothetical protein
MPNATVRANALAMPRRLFLAAGPAAAVFTALRGAKAIAHTPLAADSRLFELIAEGRRWWEQIGVYCTLCDNVVAERDGGEVQSEHQEKLDEAHSRYQDAFDEAVSTVPQTVAGLRALLGWVKRDCEGISLPDGHVAALVENLLESPVLAVEG